MDQYSLRYVQATQKLDELRKAHAFSRQRIEGPIMTEYSSQKKAWVKDRDVHMWAIQIILGEVKVEDINRKLEPYKISVENQNILNEAITISF